MRSGLSIYLVWFSRELWSFKNSVWDQLETCSFLPCRFLCSEIHSYLVNRNKHPSEPFTTYTLPLHSHSMPQSPCKGDIQGPALSAIWSWGAGSERWSDLSAILCIFSKIWFLFPLSQKHLGAFISPVDICQPCGILGLNLDGISRAEAQDRVNLIIPLGKFFSMSKFERTTLQGNGLCPYRDLISISGCLHCLPSSGKGWETGCVITVNWAAFKKGHLNKCHFRPSDTHSACSGLLFLNSCIDDLDTQQGLGTVVVKLKADWNIFKSLQPTVYICNWKIWCM